MRNMNRKIRWPGRPAIPIRRREGGYVAEGPGFYLWDEDPREVVRVVREFARGNFRVAPTSRLLRVPTGDEGTAPA
jgi:hypothetical protein